jgi:hypothetical protein
MEAVQCRFELYESNCTLFELLKADPNKVLGISEGDVNSCFTCGLALDNFHDAGAEVEGRQRGRPLGKPCCCR